MSCQMYIDARLFETVLLRVPSGGGEWLHFNQHAGCEHKLVKERLPLLGNLVAVKQVVR